MSSRFTCTYLLIANIQSIQSFFISHLDSSLVDIAHGKVATNRSNNEEGDNAHI